ncbi:MAG: hypothetical protein OEM97_08685 [Acidimicrobiia bacterium]|nr:hypothetical protein [Acidimicrobiia bacterium]
MRKPMLAFIAAAAMVATAACGGDTLTEQIIENAGGPGVDVEIDQSGDDFKISVEGEDGESITIGGGEIPDSLNIPVPTGGDVMNTFAQGTTVSVTLSWPASEYDSLVEYYENWMAEQPTDFSKTTSSFDSEDGTIRTTSWYSEEGSMTVLVSDCYSISSDGLDAVCVTLNQGE